MDTMQTYPQPREGVAGTLRDQDDLLSLDDAALPRRQAMMALAWHLHGATLRYGDKLGDRLRNPQIGDLVLETTSSLLRSDEDRRVMGLGILLAHREERVQTDEEHAASIAAGEFSADDKRWHDDAWYVQYGPQPDDVCRWVNCRFVTVPTTTDFNRT